MDPILGLGDFQQQPGGSTFPWEFAVPDLSMPYLLGVGFYKKEVDIPSDWSGCVASLEIGGARMNAWVWVNGQYAGYHRFSMIPWELPITGLSSRGRKTS